MRLLVIMILLSSTTVMANEFGDIKQLAKRNGLNPSDIVVESIISASHMYQIDSIELTAIGIIETGLGKYSLVNVNKNHSKDVGIFQINSVNVGKCLEYNLSDTLGSALCAAKLISHIKKTIKNDPKAIARYHSKTKKHKDLYFQRFNQILYAKD